MQSKSGQLRPCPTLQAIAYTPIHDQRLTQIKVKLQPDDMLR